MPDLWMDVDTALSEVPVNIMPLLDDTDFKTIENAIAYNAAGMALYWHFVTTGGAYSVTAVTPTTGGNYDWTDQGDAGIYTIEIPASGGASINNDTEGVGWFTGKATGVLPWRGPTIGFRRAALNDLFIDGSTASTNFEDFFDGTGYAGGTAKLGIDVINWKGSAAPAMTGDAYARLGAPAGASVSADIAAVKAQTAAIEADTQDLQTQIGTDGAGLTNMPWNAAWDAEVQSECNDALVAYDPPTKAEMDTGLDALPTAAENADAVWDEAIAGHVGAGSTGAALSAAGSAGDPWSTAVPGAYGAGTAGNILGNRLVGTIATGTHNPQTGDAYARLGAPAGASVSADIAAVKAQTAAIEADTQDLQTQIGTDGAGLTNMPWNAAWDAEVQSECDDALTATVADSTPSDGTRPSVAQGILMLTRLLTEKSVSGATVTIKKEDGSTTAFTLTLNDGTSPTSITRAS